MTSTVVWVILAVVVTLALTWAYSMAQRLDRLHKRVGRSRLALEAALNRRAAVAAVVFPAVSGLARETEETSLAPGDFAARVNKEHELAEALTGCAASDALTDATARVMLAVRFYNDAVADARAVRLRPEVRLLRLGGTARLPEFFEFADM